MAMAPTIRADLNVKEPPYNAAGDGVADDSAAIQAALDRAVEIGGEKVFVPKGVYRLSSDLFVLSNTRLVGAGRGITVIRQDTVIKHVARSGVPVLGGTIVMLGATNSSVESLTVDNAFNSVENNGIAAVPDGYNYGGNRCLRCTIKDCEVLGFDTHEYLIWNLRGRSIKIIENYVRGNQLGNGLSKQEGIESFGGVDVLIQGNTIEDVGGTGVNIGSLSEVPNTDCIGIIVAHNQITNCDTGVHIGTTGDPISQCHVKNNIIFSSGKVGLSITGANGAVIDDLQFTGNSISGAKTGILCNPYSARILGINFSQNTVSGSESGMLIVHTPNVTLNGNTFRNITTWCLLGVWVDDLTLTDNSFDTINAVTIQVSSGNRLNVSRNHFKKFNNGARSAAILVSGVNGGVIANNDFYALNPGAVMYATSDCNEIRITNSDVAHKLPYRPFYNFGTNPNIGAFTLAAADRSKEIQNSLAQAGCRIVLTQTAGAPVLFTATGGAGTITVRLAVAAVGDETFEYAIVQ